jgi:hypothetical protein
MQEKKPADAPNMNTTEHEGVSGCSPPPVVAQDCGALTSIGWLSSSAPQGYAFHAKPV